MIESLRKHRISVLKWKADELEDANYHDECVIIRKIVSILEKSEDDPKEIINADTLILDQIIHLLEDLG